ncbi:MAG: preprotein translocase subunit SecE [Candidatus Pelagibacter sp.]|nr:preprotein translocase subunit SecE [Candidatus Pelagibacter sp.]
MGSSPSAPANCEKQVMKNPLKFIQEVKQEAFRITWPTKKDTLMGALMVFALSSVAAIFFLLLDQILRFLLNFILSINF